MPFGFNALAFSAVMLASAMLAATVFPAASFAAVLSPIVPAPIVPAATYQLEPLTPSQELTPSQDRSDNAEPGRSATGDWDRMLRAGEYSLAARAIGSTGGNSGNSDLPLERLRQLASHQQSHGAAQGASATWRQYFSQPGDSGQVDSKGDYARTNRSASSGSASTFGEGRLAGGGQVQADFSSLINLIQTTVEPTSWEENGGVGNITPFANGVVIDAAGVLRFESLATAGKSNVDSLTQLSRQQIALTDNAKLRFLSLSQLEAELLARARTGQAISESLSLLGGMYDIQYVAVAPQSQEIFLIGPAGPWVTNDQGIAVHVQSGKAILHLDDLVVCLRNAFHGRGVLGCSIDPVPGQFEKVNELAQRFRLTSRQGQADFITAVGPEVTVVFGAPKSSHAAQVLLTSDYHLKLLAMGNVPASPELPSYLDRCQGDDLPGEMIRWWFTLGQVSIDRSADQNVFRLNRPLVELKTESQMFAGAPNGQAKAPISLAASGFVKDFNRQFDSISQTYPIYSQLENLFELSLAAQVIQAHSLRERARWQGKYLLGDGKAGMAYALREYPEINQVNMVVNHRSLKFRSNGKIMKQTIVAISGGVDSQTSAAEIQARTAQVDDQAIEAALREKLIRLGQRRLDTSDGSGRDTSEGFLPLAEDAWANDWKRD